MAARLHVRNELAHIAANKIAWRQAMTCFGQAGREVECQVPVEMLWMPPTLKGAGLEHGDQTAVDQEESPERSGWIL